MCTVARKDAETKKHRLFCRILSLVSFQLGGADPLASLFATPMSERWALALCHRVNSAVVIALRSYQGEMRT